MPLRPLLVCRACLECPGRMQAWQKHRYKVRGQQEGAVSPYCGYKEQVGEESQRREEAVHEDGHACEGIESVVGIPAPKRKAAYSCARCTAATHLERKD